MRSGPHSPAVLPGSARAGPLPSGLAIRRAAADRVGLFRTDVPVGDWIDWWGRALALGVRWLDLPEVLVRRRLHAGNHSSHQADNSEAYLRIVRERLASRRGSS